MDGIEAALLRVVRGHFGLLPCIAIVGAGILSACGGSGGAGAGSSSALDGSSDSTLGDSSNGVPPFDAGTSSGGNDAGRADGANGTGTDSGTTLGSNNCVPPTTLTITPGAQVASVAANAAFTQAFTVTASYAGLPGADVTATSFFTTNDPGIGTFSGATFTWSGKYGGAVTVSATNCGVVGTTTLSLLLNASFGTTDAGVPSGGDAGTIVNPNTAAGQFTGSPTTVSACNPTLVYPADGVLLPPNTNVIEVHFLKGSPANNLFEISFTNSVTSVQIYTACNGTSAAYGMPLGGGCVFELDQAEWNFIADTNRNGDPVTVQVKGVGCDSTNVAASNTRQISFGQQDVVGTLYYWASINLAADAGAGGPGGGPGGGGVFSGGVFRYDFGVRGQSATPVLTPTYGGNGLCIGCHDISRDGRLMLFDYDDNDADDEYGDVNTDIFDVAARTFATTGTLSKGQAFEPGFHTWNRARSAFLLSDGANSTGNGKPSGSFTVRAPDAGLIGYTPTPPATIRGTTPDMAPDDSTVVFAASPYRAGGVLADGGAGSGYWQAGGVQQCDEWFAGASLYTTPWSDATNQIGAETLLLASNGVDNFYYPSFSPDGSLIVFNHAASGPNFHNPLARVQVVQAGVGSPVPDDLAKLNDDSTNGGLVTNSWARWAPFVQTYKGGRVLWLTMSSTRDYGLRIKNDGLENCYPTESPNGAPYSTRAFTQNNLSPGCTRAQLWMAAVRLDPNGVASGADVSYPPFWLPFQDIGTNNHLGQWAQQAFTGTCSASAVDSGAAPDAGGCAAGLCCFNGGCAPCPSSPSPPSSPPPTCAIDANCAPGTCCNGGACGACAGDGAAPGGGTSSSGGGSSGAASSGGGGGQGGCQTCLDCSGQACVAGACGACTTSAECCAPYKCQSGSCVYIIQ
jgi:hypothetical protein